ncbi:MgtC/SapB family protein [Comamonas thiooxydans]|uniref:MgtC/SapB family protein n=1 Tax=Comamonas thiooxydans TaxID=363952 RepID=UPI000B410BD1|nr:MgtC/SapB family protein [Comamonas thiooxydans]
MLGHDQLLQYWQGLPLQANLLIALHLLGALLLGMLVGYERSYNGRAAGVRTYGLVCMASCALTVFMGYSDYWFGSNGSPVAPDPSRVIQGVVSGIGFLCAGVIMRDGMSINGLTTAASMWAAAALGILVGVGFYAAAMIFALLSMLAMSLGHEIQRKLPSKDTLGLSIAFTLGGAPKEEDIGQVAEKNGYRMAMNSLIISRDDKSESWKFSLMAKHGCCRATKTELSRILAGTPSILSFSIETARN